MVNKPHRNTPKGIDADGRATIPSAYRVIKMICINERGAEYDISRIVTSFTITEELFSPILVLNLKVRDTLNFFEDFSLSGQETIELEVERDNGVERDQRIKLKFSVKEYPNYQKLASSPNIQEYNIVAISTFAYSSSLNRICRSVKGNPIANVSKIFTDDLNTQVEVKSTCVSSFDGIITIQSPIKAIEWLRGKAFDSLGAPIFAYSILSSDRVQIQSLTDMWSSKNVRFRRYKYLQFLKNRTGTPEFYQENALRILDMKSNIKLDKLNQAIRGGFSSTTRITDLANKTYAERVFDFTKDPLLPNTKLNSDKSPFSLNPQLTFGLLSTGLKSINQFGGASINNLSTNTTGNDGNLNSSTGPMAENIARAKSFYANMDAVSHMIVVYGDFNLNPGKKIAIEIPKAVNAGEYEKLGKNEIIDKSLSGDYIIATVAHTFADGIYTSKAQIIKEA